MALTPTSRRWSGVARRALAAGGVAVVATLVMAGPASAHTPRISAACADGETTLEVELTKYDPSKKNNVKVSNGDEVLVDKKDFGEKFTESWTFPGDADYVFTIEVEAGDDPDGSQGWTFTETREVKACAAPPTTTTTTTTTTEVPPTTTEAPPTTTAPPATTTPGGGSGGSGGLAETGASIAIPLVIGALLLLGGVGLLVLVRRRGSDAA